MKISTLVGCVAPLLAAVFAAGYVLGVKQLVPAPAVAESAAAQAPIVKLSVSPAVPRIGVIGDSLTLPARGAMADSWLRLLIDTRRVSCGTEHGNPQASAGRSWEYVWAESGATTQAAFDKGWVTAAANALRAGDIDAVVVMIGIDDLALFHADFLHGKPISDAQWDAACTRIEANWLRMAHALQVGKGLVVFSELPDPTGIPAVRLLLRHDDAARIRLQAITARLNGFLNDLATNRNLAVFDLVRRQRELAIDSAALRLSGITLLPLASGTEADRGFAIDGIHLGPIPSGVLAAGMIEVLNCFQAHIPPLLPAEICEHATAFTTASISTTHSFQALP